MKVLVYVEGPSDKLAMEALFGSLIDKKRIQGVEIRFFAAAKGDRKTYLLTAVPRRAVNIILNDPDALVAVIPDLYPPNKGFPHQTVIEMTQGIRGCFESVLKQKGIAADPRLTARFRVFCFKYEMEALLLAAEEALGDYLGARSLQGAWVRPVEDQNHNHPPKRVIESLFRRHGRRYVETEHAPSVLRACSYEVLADRCPQCFAPFVKFLANGEQSEGATPAAGAG